MLDKKDEDELRLKKSWEAFYREPQKHHACGKLDPHSSGEKKNGRKNEKTLNYASAL